MAVAARMKNAASAIRATVIVSSVAKTVNRAKTAVTTARTHAGRTSSLAVMTSIRAADTPPVYYLFAQHHPAVTGGSHTQGQRPGTHEHHGEGHPEPQD